MKIISIETSTDWCGISLTIDGDCIESIEKKMARKHLEILPKFYIDLQNKANFDRLEIDAVAVSIGPGSFTGLRIGLGFAKGLAFANNLPIIPVPTLEVLANNIISQPKEFSIALFSHRNIIYYQNFKNKAPIGKPLAIEWEKINKKENIFQYGCDSIIKKGAYEICRPSSRSVGALAEKNYKKWIVKNPYRLESNYISPFELG